MKFDYDEMQKDAMFYEHRKVSFDWLALWILFSTWSSLSGWTLSALGYLIPMGIAFSYSIFFCVIILFRSQLQEKSSRAASKISRPRFLALRIWLVLTGLALIGGIAYSPNNYDYLTYRFARVLYWSWEHGWRWIPTVDNRMNYSATGFEWLMAPLFILFKTDRLFFFINFISYLFLPGLIFSVFSRLGISKRICWWWMWVLPCGYCYILQAASVGNDSFAVIYFLASLHYLFRTENSSPAKNLTLSCLAVALMTGAKASNLPLVLPWLIALAFHRRYLFGKLRAPAIALVLIVAAGISFVPVALLNIHFTGDYAGDPENSKKMKLSNPVMGLLGNLCQFAKDNLAPPLLPWPVDWQPFLPTALHVNLLREFPLLDLQSGELRIEEDAGAGLGLVSFVGLFLVAGIAAKLSNPGLIRTRNGPALWIVAAVGIAWLAYMAKMGNPAGSRLIAPYYPLLIAGILVAVSLDGRIVRHSVFRWMGYIAMLSALPLVVLSPARPLYSVHLVSDTMRQIHIPSGIIARFTKVYSVYAARSSGLKELAVAIPPGERVIGLLQAGNDAEASLWRPFGTREIVEVTPQDSMEKVKALGIHFVVVSQTALTIRYHTTIEQLMARWPSTLVVKRNITQLVHVGPETWYLLSL